ncbi:MAG: hypothetical protein HYW49_11165 [Deltaproteobacteria bacterium]|nr:hypothetical protein [Deltaproteobacteria bacterium]
MPSETPKQATPLPPAPGNVVVVNSEIAITQRDNTWTSVKVDEKIQQEAPAARASDASGASAARTPGVVPPPFMEKLILDPIDLKRFSKELRAHRKSVKLKKLDCLGFLSTRFAEIVYFATVPTGALAGTLGFGSTELVSGARRRMVTPEKFPALFEIVSQGTCFLGSIEQFRAEDQQVLHGIGLRNSATAGIFPVLKKKKFLGVWVCGARNPVELSPKELKTLTKIFSDLQL